MLLDNADFEFLENVASGLISALVKYSDQYKMRDRGEDLQILSFLVDNQNFYDKFMELGNQISDYFD